MTGHIDRWCKENCDPYKFKDLEKVMNSIITYYYQLNNRLILKFVSNAFHGFHDMQERQEE